LEGWKDVGKKGKKTLARLMREKPPVTGKEIIFSSIPPQKRKDLVLYDNPFLVLAEVGRGEADNFMPKTPEDE